MKTIVWFGLKFLLLLYFLTFFHISKDVIPVIFYIRSNQSISALEEKDFNLLFVYLDSQPVASCWTSP